MKKVLFVGMVFGALALTSCKKDYKCTVKVPAELGGGEISQPYSDVKKSDAKDLEKACENGGGTWSTN